MVKRGKSIVKWVVLLHFNPFFIVNFKMIVKFFLTVKKNRVWIVTMTLVNVWHPGLYNAKYLSAMLTNY